MLEPPYWEAAEVPLGLTRSARIERANRAWNQAVASYRRSVELYQNALRRRMRTASRRESIGNRTEPHSIRQIEAVEISTLDSASKSTSGVAESLLTSRQREVARLIALGRTNQQIAEALVLTPGTAANHVAGILRRLGFSRRTEVARWAAEHGLVGDQPTGSVVEVPPPPPRHRGSLTAC